MSGVLKDAHRRALDALIGFGALTPDEAVSPFEDERIGEKCPPAALAALRRKGMADFGTIRNSGGGVRAYWFANAAGVAARAKAGKAGRRAKA